MLTLMQFHADLDTKQSVKHLPVQWQYNNVKTTFQRPCFLILLCWLWTRKHLHWKNARNARYPSTHTSFNCSKTLKKCEKKFLKIVFLTLKSWLWAGTFLLANKQLTVLYTSWAVYNNKEANNLDFKTPVINN